LRTYQSLDLSQSCSFSLSGKHYIVGGDTSQGNGRRNLEVDLSSNKLIKLQNLPIDFSGGSCVGSNSDPSITPQAGFDIRVYYVFILMLGQVCMANW